MEKKTTLQLHEIESKLIQIKGLIEALQHILPDHGASICLTDAIENRLEHLEKEFYHLWENISDQQLVNDMRYR